MQLNKSRWTEENHSVTDWANCCIKVSAWRLKDNRLSLLPAWCTLCSGFCFFIFWHLLDFTVRLPSLVLSLRSTNATLTHCYFIFFVFTALGSKIINGKKAPENLMLYMASVQNNGGQHVCGGFLISEDLVVTAAHCASGWVTFLFTFLFILHNCYY